MIGRALKHRAFLLLLGAGLLQWALLFVVTTPAWDATFYYAYARSIVFDGDLRIANDLQLSYPTTAPDFAAKGLDQVLTETGRVASPFALGSSLIWLPWLAVLRVGAAIGQGLHLLADTLTGYEWYFTASLATLSAVLGWLAFWCSWRLARRETSAFSALAAALTLLFATPLLYYQYREPLYSHATSAFVTTVVVVAWWTRHQARPVVTDAALLGGLIGLAALVRWQHLVYLALPVCSAGRWWLDQPREARRAAVRPLALYIGALGLAALLLFSPQLVQWRVFYGTWFTVPQGGAYVDWRAPFWRPVLFSTFRGILPWLPVLPPAVLGLLLLARRRARLALPLLLVLLLETYFNSSTRDWFGGGGFGPRRYTSELAILILGYANLIEALPRNVRRPVAISAGALLALHQWILLRFGLLEKIGGRVVSMYPTYEWLDGSFGTFLKGVTGHIDDLVRAPGDFLALPGSPVHLLRLNLPLTRHVGALLATVLFVVLAWSIGRRLRRWVKVSAGRHWRVAGVVVLLLAGADLWLWRWG